MSAAAVPRRVGVAYSGGSDSTVLLHATCAAARVSNFVVVALHVHHGLSPHADAWLAHAERTCARWRRQGQPIEFRHHRLTGMPALGESIEAWARQARYEALGCMAREAGVELVLLAHHQRDQAETFLLQALRRAGPAGLAGMPVDWSVKGIRFARPWLSRPQADLADYRRRHRLAAVDDESNANPRFARSRLRSQVWPSLSAAFAQVDAALAQSARWQAEAAAILHERATEDALVCCEGASLCVLPWLSLSQPRRSALLRWWLQREGGEGEAGGIGADGALVVRLVEELPKARSGSRWPVPSADGELRLYRGQLRWAPSPDALRQAGLAAAARAPVATVSLRQCAGDAYRIEVPHGAWLLRPRTAPDQPAIGAEWLATLAARPRGGGEQFQAGLGRPPRSLKKQFQAVGVPVWSRDAPLLWAADRLVHVPGLGLDARVWAPPGVPAWQIEWQAFGHEQAQH